MMEGIYSGNNQRIPNFKGLNSNMSPSSVNAKMDGVFVISRGGSHQSRSPRFDPYTSENLDSIDSTLIRYLRSASPSPGIVHSAGDDLSTPVIDAGRSRTMLENKYINSNSKSKSISFGSRGSSSLSPLSAVENLKKLSPFTLRTPPGFSRSLKDDEDVLVMDGISVGSVPGAKIRLVMESGGSPSSSSSSSLSPGSNFFKTEMCRSWEDSGSCRFGFKCQFAHGKEELRPTRCPIKNKSEVQICKSYATTGVCTYGTKCRFFHPVTTAAESAAATAHTASSIKSEQSSRGSISITGRNWSPQDDGIEVTLPSSTVKPPAREDVDAYIQAALYGHTPRRRLQVFAEFCPDHSHLSHPY